MEFLYRLGILMYKTILWKCSRPIIILLEYLVSGLLFVFISKSSEDEKLATLDTAGQVTFLFVFSYSFLVISTIIGFAEEKYNGTKELLKSMGCNVFMNMFTWLLFSIFAVITTISMIMIFESNLDLNFIKEKLGDSNRQIVAILILLYSLSLLSMAYAMTTFFENHSYLNLAVVTITSIMILHFCPFFIPTLIKSATESDVDEETPNKYLSFLGCVFNPTMGLYHGISDMTHRSLKGRATLTLSERSYALTQIEVYMSLITGIVVYSFICWYLEHINPGAHGIGDSFHFFIHSKYWFQSESPNEKYVKVNDKNKKKDKKSKTNNKSKNNLVADKNVSIANIPIVVNNATKQYKKPRILAVDKVTLSVHKGKITALLGHNCSGKSTLLELIVGRIGLTEGDVLINQIPIQYRFGTLRNKISYCPSQIILFQRLNVHQHLLLAAALKGFNWERAVREANVFIEKMGLKEYARTKVEYLSQGLQRKLQIGITFIGNADIKILDEPTNYLDPKSKSEIYDLMSSFRRETTILFSTNDMDEADMMADQTIIMSNGKIVEQGSNSFLKKKLGDFFRIHIIKGKIFNKKNVEKEIKKYVPNFKLFQEFKNEIIYTLPDDSKNVKKFPNLFNNLDKIRSREKLGVTSFSFSLPSLDDILTQNHKKELRKHEKSKKSKKSSNDCGFLQAFTLSKNKSKLTLRKPKLKKLSSLIVGQWLGLLYKKLLITSKSLYSYFLIILLMNLGSGFLYYQERDFYDKVEDNDDKMKSNVELMDGISSYFASFGVLFSLVISCALFHHFVSVEKQSNSMKMQKLYVNPSTYWSTSFIWDWLLFLLILLVPFIIGLLYKNPSFKAESSIILLFTITFYAGMVLILQTYLYVLLFKNSSISYLYLMTNSLIGLYLTLTTLKGIDPSGMVAIAIVCFSIVSPFIAISRIYVKVVTISREFFLFSRTGSLISTLMRFNFVKGIVVELLLLMVSLVLTILLMIVIEGHYIPILVSHFTMKKIINKTQEPFHSDIEKEIQKEIQKVQIAHRQEQFFILKNLSKKYGKNVIVDGINFTSKSKQCFGLIGFNGDGKSTTLNLITKMIIPTTGDIWLENMNFKKDGKSYLSNIGLCNQFHSSLQDLTGKENIELYARLKGVVESDKVINEYLELLDLKNVANVKVSKYSSGNKKKLDLAMAIVGTPDLLLLDEVTTGLDPISQRVLWDIINQFKETGALVILTSTKLRDYESSCDRISIMRRGRFVAIGELESIKMKYAQGFTIILHLKLDTNYDDKVEIVEYVTDHFIKCTLTDAYNEYLRFHIHQVNSKWYRIFQTLERALNKFEVIESYEIKEATLHDVVKSFA